MEIAYHKNGPQRKGVEQGTSSVSERDGRAPPTSKLDFALDARRRGFMPFPLEPDSAEPAFPQGDAMATQHEIVLRSWWNENSDFNVGLSTENLLTLRTTEQPETLRPLAALLLDHDVPPAVVTKRVCPNAGAEVCLHFLLPVAATVEAQSDVLFPGIDVLSTDHFVVGPGSVLDGNLCEFAANNSLPQAPAWLMEMCGVELPAESKSMNVVALKKPTPVAPIKTKENWALDAAARGLDAFPIRPYTHPGPNATREQCEAAAKAAKAPLISNWQNQATQDKRQFREWWSEWPDANIATTTERFIVVDIDPRNGGKATYEMLGMIYEFPDTAISNTQGGGNHIFYALPQGVRVKGGTNKLGPGVDIKSSGGYVLLPGSTIEGRAYVWGNDRPIALAPQWLIDMCKASKPKTATSGKRVVEEDDIAIELFTKWILKHAPYAELGEIDDKTFIVCAQGYDFACSQETVYELALGWNETHCNGLGDLERLPVVVESAGRNRDKPIGCSHPLAPGFEAVEIDETKAPKSAVRIPTSDLIQTSAQFVQGFVPPEYLVDQVLQRRFCYSITAQTGVGKTAVAMLLSAHVGAGRSLGNLDVEQGSVLYFAGENPTDIQMRWLGITRELNIDPATADVHFVPGAMPLSQAASRITEEVTRKGLRPALVVVDTAAAYFEGDDENSNTQAVAHARRLRALTELPGGPCVLILCHPTKRAADDDLIPRGGGAFLAEVDGNIALQKRESLVVASSLGKFRGRDFAPLSFELKTVHHPVLKDARGRSIPTVVARHLGEVEKQRISADTLSRENQLLAAVRARPAASLRELAGSLGWRFKNGQPDQTKVSRALDALAKAKLVRKQGRQWEVTPTGLSELERSTRPTECPETDENHCSNAATDEADTRSKKVAPTRATKRVLQIATK